MRWDEALQNYLRTLSPATARQYRRALEDFERWYRGTYGEPPDPALLTDEETREYIGFLSTVKKLRASTINLRLAAIKGLARFCGLHLTVRGVRQVQQPLEPLTGRELGRLLAAVKQHNWGAEWMTRRNLAIIALMARAGLRVGEVVNLNLDDVEIHERSGWVLIRWGKGPKERKVPLSKEARKALRDYLEVRPSWRTETPALFITKTGRRMNPRDVQRMVEEAARRAGLTKRVTPHTLRHSFATRFLQRGGDLATLQALLGHANLSTTARYLHPNATQMQEMVEDL